MKTTSPSQATFDAFIKSPQGRSAYKQACEELDATPRHLLDTGNPNHPQYDLHIFGIHHQKLMAMQHKPTH